MACMCVYAEDERLKGVIKKEVKNIFTKMDLNTDLNIFLSYNRIKVKKLC